MVNEKINSKDAHDIARRKIDIDFLFLDLNTCTRCVGTNNNLETALEAVEQVLQLSDVEVNVNKTLIDSDEKAIAHRFVTSPTIRVNGRDIALETKESKCDSCTDLCGCEEGTNCRVWIYRGQEYTEAPVAMIVEAILQEVFRTPEQTVSKTEAYDEIPDNLKRFFSASSEKDEQEAASCCTPTEQETCCEAEAKVSCCGDSPAPQECGCN